MRPDRDAVAVAEILEASRLIAQFVEGMDREAFLLDYKTQSAVVLQILLIGEAARGLSEQFRRRSASIPWSEIVRMRDKLIHHYSARDLHEIWKTAVEDIPAH